MANTAHYPSALMVSAGFLEVPSAISAPPGVRGSSATSRGVLPRPSVARRSAPCAIRIFTRSSRPLATAPCNGVHPSLFVTFAFTSAFAIQQKLNGFGLRSLDDGEVKRSRAEVVLSASISVVVEQERNQRQIGVLRHTGAYPAFLRGTQSCATPCYLRPSRECPHPSESTSGTSRQRSPRL